MTFQRQGVFETVKLTQFDLDPQNRKRVVIYGLLVDAVEIRTEHAFAGLEPVLLHDRYRGVEPDLKEPHFDHNLFKADFDIPKEAIVTLRRHSNPMRFWWHLGGLERSGA